MYNKEGINYRILLADLLAIIHRDGGHYIHDHGFEDACIDAKNLFYYRIFFSENDIFFNIFNAVKEDIRDNYDFVWFRNKK
jgi:hypothetical protein